VDGGGNVSYQEVELVRLLLSIGTVLVSPREVACPLVGSTLNAAFVLSSFIKTAQFFVAAPEVPFTADSVPVVTYNLSELPVPVFIIRPEDFVPAPAAFMQAVDSVAHRFAILSLSYFCRAGSLWGGRDDLRSWYAFVGDPRHRAIRASGRQHSQ
jgi:hypothetical protein